MGTKYMAYCSKYPYKGYVEHEIQSQFLLPFLFKLLKARISRYNIIDIKYRNC